MAAARARNPGCGDCEPPEEHAARQRRAATEATVLGNRLRRTGRLGLAAYNALLLLRSAWWDDPCIEKHVLVPLPQLARRDVMWLLSVGGRAYAGRNGALQESC